MQKCDDLRSGDRAVEPFGGATQIVGGRLRIADICRSVNTKLPISVLVVVSALGAASSTLRAEMTTAVVQAPDSPVRLDHVKILNAGDQPLVLLYAANNLTADALDTVTVMIFVFRDGMLKARQTAPARRNLDKNETKYSTMVLDGFPMEANDLVVVGVNQVQRVGSEQWWRADLQPAAEAAAKKPAR